MKYREHKNLGYKTIKSKGKHQIKELATGHIVGSYQYITEVREESRAYKLGRGFNGWTPAFMIGERPNVNYNQLNFHDLDEENDQYVDWDED